MTKEIGIGIIGGGYMGKAHAVAFSAVGASFETNLRPRLEMVAARSQKSAKNYQEKFGFNSASDDWREVVSNPKVDAVIIASPPDTHKEIALAAFENGKHVLCEKPLGASLQQGEEMTKAAIASKRAHMVGFNYIRTPAAQFVRSLLEAGEIGEITYFRGEMHEDFLAKESTPWSWRCEGNASGALGDLAPHVFNMALALMGPITRLNGELQTLITSRPHEGGMRDVSNDDRGQFMCEFENGARGHISFNRAAMGRKMGYAYEVFGTKGAIRFDQEDQNAIWLYREEDNEAEQGFKKILTNPAHPDYVNFNLGPGHGTGYQDQIIIEARDFLKAIETMEGSGRTIWPNFADGHEVNKIGAAVRRSNELQNWVEIT